MYVAIKSIARKRAPTILPKIYAALVGATLVAIAVGCRGPPQPGQGDAWKVTTPLTVHLCTVCLAGAGLLQLLSARHGIVRLIT